MDLLHILEEARAAGGDCALATVVETNGSTYRRAGARFVVRGDRRTWGAISGGCLEADIIERALRVIATGETALARYKPAADDLVIGLGSGCQGEVVVFIEPLSPSLCEASNHASDGDAWITMYRGETRGTTVGLAIDAPGDAFVQAIVARPTLLLFGASPAAEDLVRFAKGLGWCVRVGDHRPFIANDPRFAAADSIEIAPVEELPARFSYPTPTAAVVMTHHYLRDLALLRRLAPMRLAYLGLIGARDRARKLLVEAGIDESAVHAPAGLDLGADAPAEIALSIVAEIQSVLKRTTATALRNRPGRIHDAPDENAIVILAAGGSRRLGRPKQLVEIDGRSLIRRAAEAALAVGSGSVQIVVGAEVLRVRAALEGLPVAWIVNDAWQEGIASSIRAAVDAIERRQRPVETMTLMLCDQPGVTTDVLRRLLDAWRGTRSAVIASRYPEGPGVPALLHAELFPALKTLQGDIGARQLIRELDRDIVTIPLDLPDDVDTAEDLRRLRTP